LRLNYKKGFPVITNPGYNEQIQPVPSCSL
jgi:hypothetical protein